MSQVQFFEYPGVHIDLTLLLKAHIDLLLTATKTVFLRRLIYMDWKSVLCSVKLPWRTQLGFAWSAPGKLKTKSTHIVQTAIKITGVKQNKSLQSSFDQCVLYHDLPHFIAELIIVN